MNLKWYEIIIIIFSVMMLYLSSYLIEYYLKRKDSKRCNNEIRKSHTKDGFWTIKKRRLLIFISWVKKPEKDLANNIVKAILIGIISGVIIGFTGKDWNFKVYPLTTDLYYYEYGTAQGVIGGLLVALALFLVYNKKD